MEHPDLSRRRQPRTNLFVAATLSWSSSSSPVRVRNLSSSGALLETSELPRIGERVKLRRGMVAATGVVVHRNGTKIGVHFERPIKIDDWLPASSFVERRASANLQSLKPQPSGYIASAEQMQLSAGSSRYEELHGIADMLNALADAMSEDREIVGRYLDKLQVLDLASQALRRVANT